MHSYTENSAETFYTILFVICVKSGRNYTVKMFLWQHVNVLS